MSGDRTTAQEVPPNSLAQRQRDPQKVAAALASSSVARQAPARAEASSDALETQVPSSFALSPQPAVVGSYVARRGPF